MLRLALSILTLVLLSTFTASQAQTPSGRWKLRVTQENQTITFLVALTESEGKWVGDFLGSSVELQREPQFGALEVQGGAVRFTLTFAGQDFVSFDGVLAKDGKKLSGSMTQFGGPLRVTELATSQLKKVNDPVELAREDLAQLESGPALYDAGFLVLGQASTKKLPIEEVRGIADKLARVATAYGSRWERTVAVKLANLLATQEPYRDVALAQARRAERMLTDESPSAIQMEVLDTLAQTLTRSGKADEAKKYLAAVQKLEAKDYGEFVKARLNFPTDEYKGRKGKSERVVLLESVTTSEAPPTAAAELAVLALGRTFKPTEVLSLNYHVQIPGAGDPLSSPDSMDRVNFYAEQIRSLPLVLLNGKVGPKGAMPAVTAKDRYAELRAEIEKQLELPAAGKLTLALVPGEKGVTAKAVVSDLENPGEKIKLRFVLAEDRIRYTGGSGVRYHSSVVRAVLGDAKGFSLTKKTQDQTVSFDVNEIRLKQSKYLEDFAKSEGEFSRPDRPLALTNLKLVAFIQNDTTGEILQAAQIEVK